MPLRWGELDEHPFPSTVTDENQLSEEVFLMRFTVEFRKHPNFFGVSDALARKFAECKARPLRTF